MNESKYWLDQTITDILSTHPEGEIVVSSGHSPSGIYHVGTLREILTANLITWGIRERGRSARHIDVVDDFDAFRKIPAGLPDSYREHLGKPLYLVPDHLSCHSSYAEHYLAQLYSALEKLEVKPETIRSHEKYLHGEFAESVRKCLINLTEVRQIITEVGRRKLDESWAPVQILSDKQNLREWKFQSWDSDSSTIEFVDQVGEKAKVSLEDEPGRVKLDWRLDWPARWALYGVNVEPFGRDHATKGGSYDTGKELVKKIFKSDAPYPVPYEFVTQSGETKKMSKSTGNVITPQDMLEVMPPEVLRYFFAKPRPSRTLPFDAGLGIFNLVDDYSKQKASFLSGADVSDENAVKYSIISSEQEVSAVPFNHMVAVFQAARGDVGEVNAILNRTGYTVEPSVLSREVEFVRNWLDKYAPDSLKFEVQETLPDVELTEGQSDFLKALVKELEGAGELEGAQMHEKIYAAKEAAGISPGEAFKSLYLVILGKESGPKAGWFLASLPREWLISRLREI